MFFVYYFDMQTYTHENILHKKQFDLQFTIRFDLIIDNNFYSPFHWHNHIEVIYMLEGKVELTIENKSRILEPGEVAIVNSEKIHSSRLHGKAKYILLQVPLSALSTVDGDADNYVYLDYIPKENTAKLSTVLMQMLDVSNGTAPGIKLKFVSLLYELLFVMISSYRAKTLLSEISVFSKSGINRISPVISYIEKNFRKEISLSDAASIINVTPEHLCRIFKAYTKQTLTEYITSLRIASFYQSLQNSTEKISTLLEENGIKNYKVFIREFKKTYGKTPQQIRQGKN